MHRAARIYAAYAAFFLAVTLISGAWLRAAFVWPEVLGGFTFGWALHAHSHVAFFGWTAMALFAVILVAQGGTSSPRWLRLHAHAVGLASAAAFAGFLASGYAAHTIAVSALHVVLWIGFAFGVWLALDDTPAPQRTFFRAALAFLVVAGVGAMTPGYVMARRIADPWINQLSVQSFLTPFVSGWLIVGVMGVAYSSIQRPSLHRPALWLTVAGVIPSTFLHTVAPPPHDGLALVGRIGTLLLGAGAICFAADLLRCVRVPAMLRIAGVAMLFKGVAEIAAALALTSGFVTGRPLTIAYLHLVLLAAVTPALLAGLRVPVSRGATTVFGSGVAVMIGALALLGTPPLLVPAAALGLSPGTLYPLAFAGGAAAAAAVLPALARFAWLEARAARAADATQGSPATRAVPTTKPSATALPQA